jgi:NAD(P)-dependent dehydrogenase (short-subunit alcohol dehydrogenase family)
VSAVADRTVLVTGANGGIGRSLVAQFEQLGHRVLTLDVRGPADIVADLATEELPGDLLRTVDICVSNAASNNGHTTWT